MAVQQGRSAGAARVNVGRRIEDNMPDQEGDNLAALLETWEVHEHREGPDRVGMLDVPFGRGRTQLMNKYATRPWISSPEQKPSWRKCPDQDLCGFCLPSSNLKQRQVSRLQT